MNIIIHITIFVVSAYLLYFSGNRLITALMRLSKIVRIPEFIVAFFVMAIASSLPNLLVGVTAAFEGIPELSVGDIFGNNFIALTLAVSAAVIFSPKKFITASGQVVQTSAFITALSAVVPIILFLDGSLSRGDGIVLIIAFIMYTTWLWRKRNHFNHIYKDTTHEISPFVIKQIVQAIADTLKVVLTVALMVVASLGIVYSATFFMEFFGISLLITGLLITSFGNALPEIYFSIISARRKQTQLILGNLMGAVIFPATLVLGIVALIHPIVLIDMPTVVVSRIFLCIAALTFVVCVRSRERVSLLEACILFGLYVVFVVVIGMGMVL